jgi:hypothetical protein
MFLRCGLVAGRIAGWLCAMQPVGLQPSVFPASSVPRGSGCKHGLFGSTGNARHQTVGRDCGTEETQHGHRRPDLWEAERPVRNLRWRATNAGPLLIKSPSSGTVMTNIK